MARYENSRRAAASTPMKHSPTTSRTRRARSRQPGPVSTTPPRVTSKRNSSRRFWPSCSRTSRRACSDERRTGTWTPNGSPPSNRSSRRTATPRFSPRSPSHRGLDTWAKTLRWWVKCFTASPKSKCAPTPNTCTVRTATFRNRSSADSVSWAASVFQFPKRLAVFPPVESRSTWAWSSRPRNSPGAASASEGRSSRGRRFSRARY